MPTYRITGVVKEAGVESPHLIIAVKADRGTPSTIGEELARTTANASGLFEVTFDDWTGNVALIALDMTTGTTRNLVTKDWLNGADTANDYYFSDVVNLLHMEGADGSTAFIDELGHTVTAYQHASMSIVQAKYGSTSLTMDGFGDRIGITHDPAMLVGNQDFTVEAWVYCSRLTGLQTIFCKRENSWLGGQYDKGTFLLQLNATNINVYIRNGTSTWAGGYIAPFPSATYLNKWTHVAMSKNYNLCRVFADGVELGSFTAPLSVLDDDKDIYIGAELDGTNPFQGYIDEFRYTVGTGRYVQDFPPPGAAFPDQ